MSTELFELLSQYGAPAVILIAAGTIVGAAIAAVSSYVIARYNASSARQLAIDAAHRQYREQLANDTLDAARGLLAALHQLTAIALRQGTDSDWQTAMTSLTRPRQKTDFRRPTDDVFRGSVGLLRELFGPAGSPAPAQFIQDRRRGTKTTSLG